MSANAQEIAASRLIGKERAAMASSLIPVALSFLAAASLPAAAEQSKPLKDWVVQCDNVRRCVALGLEKEDVMQGVFVRLVRDATEAFPTVQIVTSATKPGPYQIRIAFDDLALPVPAVLNAEGPDGSQSVRSSLPTEQVPAFLAGLRRAKTLVVTQLKGDAEDLKAEIPLDEVLQALGLMDAAQGHVGTRAALAAPGAKEPNIPVTAPALPVIKGAKAGGIRPGPRTPKPVTQALRAADCDEPPTVRPIRERLDAKTTLWGFMCWRGAYNETYAFFVHRDGASTAAPAVFRQINLLGGEETDDTITNPDFDRKTLTMSFMSLGRGLGDCGQHGRYVWDGQQFALAKLTSMPACRGVSADDWPVIWRSQLR
jgi:hypothetical protein